MTVLWTVRTANDRSHNRVAKGTDIGKLTVGELQRIENWVNNYPRKIFGFKSANEMVA